ncbi:MAG: thymidine phosphorylase, partial [Pseudomonadota bacterium]|nr:thymidine phosphorylase [Pseudomonadota bacterium]
GAPVGPGAPLARVHARDAAQAAAAIAKLQAAYRIGDAPGQRSPAVIERIVG